ncbi:MAG: 3-keto-disaccharide hydrolase [Planctomycetaceae bacterium]
MCVRELLVTLAASFLLMTALSADEPAKKVFTDPAKADADFKIQGEYEGKIGASSTAGVQLVALGDGKFQGVLFAGGLPGGTWDRLARLPLTGESRDGKVTLTGTNFAAELADGLLKGKLDDQAFELKRVERRSPTMGAKPPEGALVLFDGTNLDQWESAKLEEGQVLGVLQGNGARTKKKFKDYTLHLEFRTPYQPNDRGQARGNSGLYLNDQYELQVLDSFGLSGENNECGGFYSIAKPKLNMCLPPLAWQTYDVDFQMARFDPEGRKIKPASLTARHNGVVIHDNLELPKFTPGGGLSDESQPGSIYLQNHSNPVHFRNIWIIEKN